MSDEHEHEHEEQPHMFTFFQGPSKEQMEQMKMESEANGHDTRTFFDTLTLEQLGKLSAILHVVVTTDGMAGAYYQGLIAAVADYKHKFCMACGRDHDKEARDLLTPLPDITHKPDDELVKDSKKYNELMYLYNMEQDDDGSDRVMCKGCQTWSINLKDRMLRPPGIPGCEGCIQKNKWG